MLHIAGSQQSGKHRLLACRRTVVLAAHASRIATSTGWTILVHTYSVRSAALPGRPLSADARAAPALQGLRRGSVSKVTKVLSMQRSRLVCGMAKPKQWRISATWQLFKVVAHTSSKGMCGPSQGIQVAGVDTWHQQSAWLMLRHWHCSRAALQQMRRAPSCSAALRWAKALR